MGGWVNPMNPPSQGSRPDPPRTFSQIIMEDLNDGVVVRYGCKCGYLAPLQSLFFSEMCQKLVCRQPRCSVEEFEAYYCGYLLVNMPSKEASMYQNRSSRCFSCVDCETPLSTAFHDALQKYFFFCAHCHWDSVALGLVEDDPDMLLMSAVARERECTQEDVFHTLLSHYTSASAAASSSARSGRTYSTGAARFLPSLSSPSLLSLAESMKELQHEQQMKKFRMQRMAEMGGWKYAQALAKIQEKEQWLIDQRSEHEHPQLRKQLDRFPAPSAAETDGDEELTKLASLSQMSEISTLHQRWANPLDQPRDATRLFPPRPLLRVKRTWRCVESIERGSAGILVKPQISPMSGDSSLPVPASWFKKANLAVHYLPIVSFHKLPYRVDGSDRVECILLVENPLDDPIRIVCQPVNALHETIPEQEGAQVCLLSLG